jgi:pimeloyl-ACP methyl ester carboxylesterase
MDFAYVVVPALLVLIGILAVWFAIWRLRSPRAAGAPRWRTTTSQVVISLIAVVGLALAGVSGWNAVQLYRYRHSPPGQIFSVDGHAMRIQCMGSGSPAIVLDAGLGNDGLIWSGVQPVLAKTTQVCSFDRPGFGWSDAVPAPHDADHLAQAEHGLLQAAGIDGPVVLMGHSIAGIYIRAYASKYPEKVAGLVFVDGSTPLQQRHPAFKALNSGPPNQLRELMNQAVFSAGLPRLRGECSRTYPGFDAQASRLQAEDQCHAPFAGIAGEVASFDQSGEETVHTGPYGTLPILIFSQDPAKSVANGEPKAVAEAWNQMQDNLKALSTRSRRIIAKDSPHYIQLARPELLEREVPLFIEQIRGSAPEPADYGSTVTE